MTRLVFSPHLNTCLEKASTPTDTAAYGNGDRPGGGGETRRLSPGASVSMRGRRAGPAAGVGDTPRPSLPPLRAQPGPPSRLLLSPPLSGLTRDRLGHRHHVRLTCRKSLVCTWGQEAVSLGTREPGGPRAVCLGWAASGWVEGAPRPRADVPAPASSQPLGRQDSLPGKTRDHTISGGSLGRPFRQDVCSPS